LPILISRLLGRPTSGSWRSAFGSSSRGGRGLGSSSRSRGGSSLGGNLAGLLLQLLGGSGGCDKFLSLNLGLKPLYAPCCIDEPLGSGEERVACRTDFHLQLLACGHALKSISAGTGDHDFVEFGVNLGFHKTTSFRDVSDFLFSLFKAIKGFDNMLQLDELENAVNVGIEIDKDQFSAGVPKLFECADEEA